MDLEACPQRANHVIIEKYSDSGSAYLMGSCQV